MRLTYYLLCALLSIIWLDVSTSTANFYDILGVDKDATAREIRKAYKKLALQLHPDKLGPNATAEQEEAFIKLSEAYEVLSDPDRRASYDSNGETTAPKPVVRQYHKSSFSLFSLFNTGVFDFEYQVDSKEGLNIVVELPLTLEQSFMGYNSKLNVTRKRRCSECDGTRCAANTVTHTCEACNGRGKNLGFSQPTMGGYEQAVFRECQYCHGHGSLPHEPCPVCQGLGVIDHTKEFSVNFPPGVPHLFQVGVQNEGHVSLLHGTGNLVLVASIIPEEYVTIRDRDIIFHENATLFQALLGTSWVKRLPNGTDLTFHHSKPAIKSFSVTVPGGGLPAFQQFPLGNAVLECEVLYPVDITIRQQYFLLQHFTAKEVRTIRHIVTLQSGMFLQYPASLTAGLPSGVPLYCDWYGEHTEVPWQHLTWFQYANAHG